MERLPIEDRHRRREIAPGALHLPGWLNLDQQRELVDLFSECATTPVPLRAPLVRGRPMSVQMVCLGWHWQPYRYSRIASDVNGAPVAPFPEWLGDLARDVVADAYGPDGVEQYRPNVALLNQYDDRARMGMHQDKDERVGDPVVSLSVGNTCLFRFGNTEHRAKPYHDVELVSGDAFVFGRASRFAFHGVTKVIANSAPRSSPWRDGRINCTIRVTGLA